MVSPLEIQLNLLCNEEIKENTLKQLRSLITSFSSEITEEFYESSIDKIHIFDVFLMDFENIDEKTLKSLLLANFDKITGLLAWDRNKTHVYFKVNPPYNQSLYIISLFYKLEGKNKRFRVIRNEKTLKKL